LECGLAASCWLECELQIPACRNAPCLTPRNAHRTPRRSYVHLLFREPFLFPPFGMHDFTPALVCV
jgi:hypothetical protein